MADKAYMDSYKERMRQLGSVIAREPEAQEALNQSIVAMKKIATRLANTDYDDCDECEECGRKGLSPDLAAKTLGYIAKVVSETTRLLEYAKGNAESRTEVKGLEDLLRVLKPNQFEQVCTWIEQGENEGNKSLN
jgi:hypothetical protein